LKFSKKRSPDGSAKSSPAKPDKARGNDEEVEAQSRWERDR
jgi:hypothetical protein